MKSLCTTCGQLRADTDCGDGARDRCRCEDVAVGGRRTMPIRQQERSIPCRMCIACAMEEVGGHTRWRGLLCEACKPVALRLNHICGRLIVPLGIHSVVNGSAMAPNRQVIPPQSESEARALRARFEAFAVQMVDGLRRAGNAQDAADRLVVRRLASFGHADRPTVPVAEYLEACVANDITAADGWDALFETVRLSSFVDEQVRTFLWSPNS